MSDTTCATSRGAPSVSFMPTVPSGDDAEAHALAAHLRSRLQRRRADVLVASSTSGPSR